MTFDHQSSDNDRENYFTPQSPVEDENKPQSITHAPSKSKESLVSKQLKQWPIKMFIDRHFSKAKKTFACQVLILVANKKLQISFLRLFIELTNAVTFTQHQQKRFV